MPKICPKYARSMPKICPRYAQDMPEIYPKYARDMPKVCLKHAQDMSKICPRYTQDMPKICLRWVITFVNQMITMFTIAIWHHYHSGKLRSSLQSRRRPVCSSNHGDLRKTPHTFHNMGSGCSSRHKGGRRPREESRGGGVGGEVMRGCSNWGWRSRRIQIQEVVKKEGEEKWTTHSQGWAILSKKLLTADLGGNLSKKVIESWYIGRFLIIGQNINIDLLLA